MEKIVLTAEEKQLIEKHLNGQYNPFFATEVEQAMFNNLIDKAEAYEEAVNGIDERMEEPNCDLLSWYYKKYQGGLKLTAEAVTRKITEAEFEKLFFNLTAEEKRKVRSDLILDDKLDPFVDSKHKEKVKVMSDEEIDRLALD